MWKEPTSRRKSAAATVPADEKEAKRPKTKKASKPARKDTSKSKQRSQEGNNKATKRSKQPQTCKFCSKSFRRREDRRWHEQNVHLEGSAKPKKTEGSIMPKELFQTIVGKNKSVEHLCLVCLLSFSSESGLNRHWDEDHRKK